MELSTLRVFMTVANERSFSRAAEKLARTQPAVSLALQRLESELVNSMADMRDHSAGRLVIGDNESSHYEEWHFAAPARCHKRLSVEQEPVPVRVG